MKKTLILVFMSAAAVMAQEQTPKPAAKKPAASKKAAKVAPKAAPAYQPMTIPADATPNPNGTYAWTDKAGRNWTFSRTPFGISKIENPSGAAAPAGGSPKESAVPATQIQSTDMGDKVKFSRASPFGAMNWEKKKSELTDEERAIFLSQHPDNHQ